MIDRLLCCRCFLWTQVQGDLARYIWDTPSPDVHSFAFQSALADPVPEHLDGWRLYDLRREMARMVRGGTNFPFSAARAQCACCRCMAASPGTKQ
jgi:hypothetical protein